MKKITLMIIVSLLSFCTYGQLALEEFEAPWTGSPPAPPGWVVRNEIGNITWVRSTAGFALTPPYQGTHAAYLDRENVLPSAPLPTNWLITPQFNSPNNGILHFYSRLTQVGNQGSIYRIMIAPVANPATPVNDLPWVNLIPDQTESQMNPVFQDQYAEKSITIPTAYANQQVRIAFIMIGDQGDRWLIDNVEVISECNAPSTQNATNITLDSADLSWQSPAGVTQWEVEIVLEEDAPTGTGVLHSGAPLYPAQGLIPNSDYKYYVRSKCSDGGESAWIGPYFFSTLALGESCNDPIVIPSALPYTTTDNTSNYADNYEGVPGTGCNATGSYLSGNDVVYSYTPTSSGSINVNLSNTGGPAGVFVYASCAAIGSNCINGATASATAAGNIASIPVTANTTYYIVVSTNTSAQVTPYTLTLQQVFCAAPTGLAVSGQTSSSANLSWAAGAATSWQIAVQLAGTGIPTAAGQEVTQNTNYTVSATTGTSSVPFAPATNYEYYVRANCGDGTYSIWTGPFAFSTTQIPVTLNYSENFDGATHGWSISNGNLTNKWFVGSATFNSPGKSLYISNDNGVSNNYTVTSGSTVHAYRDIQMPATVGQVSLAFDLKSGGESTIDRVRVWLVPTSFIPTPNTQITTAGGNIQLGGNFNLTPNWTTQNVVFDASAYAGGTRRLIFEWRNDTFGGAQPGAAIDNVAMAIVTCSAPTALTLGTVTTSSANVSWTAPGGTAPLGYEYYYSQSNTQPNASTPISGTAAGTTTNISPLQPSQTYYFWVRSSCGTADKSFWTGPLIINVPQIPATLNFSQNFDAGAHNFTLSNGTQPNKWFVGPATFNSAPNSLYVTTDNGATNGYNVSAASVVHAYRDLSIPATAGEITATFDYKTVGESGWDYIRVWMVPVDFFPTAGTQITAGAGRVQLGGNFQVTPNWTTASFDTPVTAYQGLTRRLVFEWRNDGIFGDQPAGAIDNVSVNVVTCPKPQNLAATNITNTSATLDWTEAGSATSWEVAFMPAAGAAEPTTPGTVVTGTSEFTPPAGTFVYGTQYVFYVRANCGATDGLSRWSGPFAFALRPVNDECAQPTTVLTNADLVCTNTANGSILGATASTESSTCTGTEDDDVWFEFVATNTAHNINLNNITGSTTDLVHSVYSGTSCGALTLLYCSDPNNSVANNLVVGQTYKVRVWSWTGTAGQTSAFQLCITTPPPPPVNDACSGAFALTVNPTLECAAVTAGTIYSATASPEASTCLGTEDDDVWFTFVATNTTHRISLLNITGSTTDLVHGVFAGTDCAALTQVYCSDPNESWANNLTVGQTYYVRVYSWTATAGQTSAFNVCVGTPPPPPANDDCAGAVTVPVNPTAVCEDIVSGTVQSATASPEANTCGNVNDEDDVWFEFTAEGPVHIIELKNIAGSSTDMYHVVYSGDQCGTLTQLYCSDPNYSIATGLTPGTTYKIRVYTNTATLNQTTTFDLCVSTPPTPATNDECSSALVIPVNTDSSCTLTATSNVYGATASPEPNSCGNTNDDDDVWFEFTATNATHLISLTNFIGSTTDLYHVVYAGDQCGALSQLYCSDANTSTATGMIPGNLYKVRVYSNAATSQTTQFDICVKVPNTPITVDTDTYTTEQLVTDVLFNTPCAVITNITSKSGADYGDPASLAYFDAQASTFPFAYGVVMSTGSAVLAEGPFGNGSNTGGGNTAWTGDTDLDAIVVANDPAQVNGTENATVLEFDFVPLINTFTFDFLFASTEYGTFQCSFSDAFAFILTDADGNSENLAVIPNTNIPVAVTTIRDGQFNTGCGSANIEYFGQMNANEPLSSAINFNGQTKGMQASASVTPGETYHIKLVIADYSDNIYNSAVFLGGGSFNIGSLDLGANLLVEEGTAICDTQSKTLDTGLVGDQYIFSWYKDGVEIDGATESTYTVTETGNYGVLAEIEGIDCTFEGSVIIEFFPPVNETTGDPLNLTICDASGFGTFDITPNLALITSLPADPENFTSTVHLSEADALSGDNPVDPATYAAFDNTVAGLQTLWIRTVYSVTTCVGVKSFDLIVQDLTPQYTIDADFSICDGTTDTIDVVITDTDPTPVTYTWTQDGNPLPDTTPSITVSQAGAYTVTIDRTGCSATATVNVTVTPIPVADAPADITACEGYVLPALSVNNSYALADGTPVAAGTEIVETTTLRVIAESATTPNCTSENTFTVTINDSPELDAVQDVAACDSYVLPAITTGNYYTGPGATGTMLNANDVISTSQTIYVYAETGTVPNCSSEASFEVTINETPVADAPGDVNSCDSYVLPALTSGDYYTGPGGTGIMLSAGEVIDSTQLLYVYAQTATTPNCTDENTFTVNITPTPAFGFDGPYTACIASNVTINITGANFDTNTASYAWTFEGTPVTGTNSIVASGFGTYTVTVTVNNCSHTESIVVTQDTSIITVDITDGCVDNVYMVSANPDVNGSFNPDTATYAWTGPEGFTSNAREFAAPAQGEYFVTVTTADGCVGEESFIVNDTSCNIQRGISPNGDGLNDNFDLSTLNVRKLTIYNRYGQEVYSKNDYKDEWNGLGDNGDELPTGTYFYMVERQSGETNTGWVYINRQE